MLCQLSYGHQAHARFYQEKSRGKTRRSNGGRPELDGADPPARAPYSSTLQGILLQAGCVASSAAGSRTPGAAEGCSDERKEQREDAKAR